MPTASSPALPLAQQLRQLDAWYREETERWSQERVELCKKSSQLEQRHTQWQHELRRRDVEIEKLQKHLATNITSTERRRRASNTGNRGSASSSSPIVLSSAGASSSKLGRWVCLRADWMHSRCGSALAQQQHIQAAIATPLTPHHKRLSPLCSALLMHNPGCAAAPPCTKSQQCPSWPHMMPSCTATSGALPTADS